MCLSWHLSHLLGIWNSCLVLTVLERCTGRKTNRRASCTSSELLVISTSVCGNKQKREKSLKRRKARRKEPHLLENSVWCPEERSRDRPCAHVKSAGVMHQAVPHRRDLSCAGGMCPVNTQQGPWGRLASSWELSCVCQMKKELLTRRLMCLIHPPQEYDLSY